MRRTYTRSAVPVTDLSLEEELALIRKAQAGDRAAANRLIVSHDAWLRQLAKRIAVFTGAYKEEDDIAQVGRISLSERIARYNFNYVIEKRREDPSHAPARISAYAYRDIRSKMFQHACRYLEAVRTGASKITYAAHRDLDRGMPAEEVAAKYRMTLDTVRALERHTVELADDSVVETETVEDRHASHEEWRDRLLFSWYALSPEQRVAVTLRHSVPSRKERARILGMTSEALCRLEAEMDQLVRDLDGAE